MTEIEIQALQEIWPEPLIETLMTPVETYKALRATSKSVADTWLLGFLNSKDVLIAQWGEFKKERVRICFHDYAECGCNNTYEDKIINQGWQYHSNQQAGFTVSERISYWKENKK